MPKSLWKKRILHKEDFKPFFFCLQPDQTITKLGGEGLALFFKGEKPGKRPYYSL